MNAFVPPHGAKVFVVWQSHAFPATMLHHPTTGTYEVRYEQPPPSIAKEENQAPPKAAEVVEHSSEILDAAAQLVAGSRAMPFSSPAAASTRQPFTAASAVESRPQPQPAPPNTFPSPAAPPPSSGSSLGTRTMVGGITIGKDGLPGQAEITHRPMKNGQLKRICSRPGCNSFVTKYGLCKKHGGMDKCILPGCNTNAEARGLCRKHGATGFCSSPGCNSYAHARGFCRKHCDKGVCAVEECKSYAQAQGLCRKHGGRATCTTHGCDSFTQARGLCRKHGKKATCTASGCKEPTEARRLCKTHLLSGYALLHAASLMDGMKGKDGVGGD
eukprot:gene5286-16218_t